MIKKQLLKITLCLGLVLSLPISMQANANMQLQTTTWHETLRKKINALVYAPENHALLMFIGVLGLGWLISVLVNKPQRDANLATKDKDTTDNNQKKPADSTALAKIIQENNKNEKYNINQTNESFIFDRNEFENADDAYHKTMDSYITQAIDQGNYTIAYDMLKNIKKPENDFKIIISTFNKSRKLFIKNYVNKYLEQILKKEYKCESSKHHLNLISRLIYILEIDYQNESILSLACSHKNNLPLVVHLITQHNIKASLNVRCKDTSLGICIINGFYDIANYLLNKLTKKDLNNKKYLSNESYLSLILQKNNITDTSSDDYKILIALLDKGCDVKHYTQYYKPFDLVLKLNNPTIAKLFTDRGCYYGMYDQKNE